MDLHSTSRLLKLNAIEDVTPESGEPALFTHSDGELNALNDSKLEPCRFIIPSSSRVSMQLPKLDKGKRTFSLSHRVTRSKAKRIAEGRKKAHIRGVDTSDEEGESWVESIRSAFKSSCHTIKAKKPSTPAPVPQNP